MENTPKIIALRKKRARAETRFRWYGRAGLMIAVFALVFLLFTIISRGWSGFIQTEIQLSVPVDSTLLGIDVSKAIEPQLLYVQTLPLIQEGLKRRFPEVKDRGQLRKLYALISQQAEVQLKHSISKQPYLFGSDITLWLRAGDMVDRYQKTRDRHSRDSANTIKLNDDQKQWIAELDSTGEIRLGFNSEFFTKGDSRGPERAGFLGSMVGSLLTLLICMCIAFPLGVLTAVYLEEFASKNRMTDVIEVNINNLAAVPSIVFGLLGLAIYLNLFGLPRSASLVGGMTLSLMILPTIIISTRASLKAIPPSIRDAARALGASPMQVVFHHVVPLAMPGIMTGTILGVARAIGETAPLLMIGMVAFVADVPRSFVDPATAMPVQIYLWASSPEIGFVEKTAAGIMVLLGLLLLLNSLAILIRKRFEQRW
jgi:phosphate transport system permease protein